MCAGAQQRFPPVTFTRVHSGESTSLSGIKVSITGIFSLYSGTTSSGNDIYMRSFLEFKEPGFLERIP